MYKSEDAFKKYVAKVYPGWNSTSKDFRNNIEQAFAAGCHFIMDEIEKNRNSQEKCETTDNTARDAIALEIADLKRREKHGNGMILIRVAIEILEKIAQQHP